MAIRVTVNSVPKNRVSINTPQRETVRTVGITPNTFSLTSLSSLSDVDATRPANNYTLVYDANRGKYVVEELPFISGGTF